MNYINKGIIGHRGVVVGVQAVLGGTAADGVRADPSNAVAGDIGVGFGTAAGKGELGFEGAAVGVELAEVLVLRGSLRGIRVGEVTGVIV